MLIREIAATDSEAAARLSGELGYPVTPEAMSRRISALSGMPRHAVYVACIEGEVAGWIDVGIVQHLQTEPYCEIGGLVVSSAQRSAGIGASLVARAEQWATEHGIQKMVVRSNVIRDAAHRFYLREGYFRTKTSSVFTKELTSTSLVDS